MSEALQKIKKRMEQKKASAPADKAPAKQKPTKAHTEPAPADGVAGIVAGLYTVKKKAAGDTFVVESVTIRQMGFLSLLRWLGFRRYDVQDTFIIVRIQDNVIEQAPIHRLREVVIRWLISLDDEDLVDDCPKEMLLEKVTRSLGTLTTEEKIGLLFDLDKDTTEILIVEDTKDDAFFFYLNGFVQVNRDGVALKPYSQLPGYIWRDQILPRHFSPLEADEVESCFYARFARNVSECVSTTGDEIGDPARYQAFRTITGYNLHRFFKTKLRATIFLDARVTDDPDGRSGKSLHCKAMQAILNADPANGRQAITIDGKKYDPQNRFNLDELHVSTRLVIFDDIKRGFQIEDFFNAIVDGLVRERKGDVNKVRIFSKILFTLNYTISIRGGSARDRVIEFEFADYYSERRSPEMEFGHWFFRDWDGVEWNRFDNWMMQCVAQYFQTGIIIPQTINLEARKLRDETAQEFITWMEDQELEHEKRYSKRELYAKFLDIDPDDNKARNRDFNWLKPRKFTDWLRLYAQYRPEIAGYKEWRSSGADYILFLHNAPVSNPFSLEVGGGTVKLFPAKADKCKLAEGGAVSDAANLPF